MELGVSATLDPGSPSTAPQRLLRWLRRLRYGIVVVLVLLIAAHAWYDRHLVAQVEKELGALALSGAPVTLSELKPEPLPPERNALTAYREAVALLSELPTEPTDNPVLDYFSAPYAKTRAALAALTPERRGALSGALDVVAPILDKACEADQRPDFQLAYSYALDDPESLLGDDLSALGAVARFLAAQAYWDSLCGRPEEAAAWVTAGLRLSNRLTEEPLLITGLIRASMARMAMRAGQEVFERGGIPAQAHDALHSELAQLTDRGAVARFLATEQAFALEHMAAYWGFRSGIRAYVARPWLNRNRLATLRFYREIMAAVEVPDPDARAAAYEAAFAWAEDAPILVSRITPNIFRALAGFEQAIAEAQLLALGLDLQRFKAAQGGYPETLTALALPAVALAGEDVHNGVRIAYRRDSDGFMMEAFPAHRAGSMGHSGHPESIVWRVAR